MTNKWKPSGWRQKPIVQAPEYPDKKALEKVEKTLKNLPPLVSAGESRKLQQYLADASEGKCFVLQGGDCAESFADFHPNYIRDTLRVLLQMSVILTFGASLPVIKLSRLGGQFAKPRSEPTEKKDGKELDSYRGDIINGLDFTEESRTPDPNRMIQAYNQSASTLNLLRALSQGGYADLNQVHRWNLGFVEKSPQGEKYKEIANQITESLSFMEACGINSDTVPEIREMKLFTSHESLLLPYEEALTRIDSTSGKWYDCSAHMLWAGDRTRDINGAHINFLSGLANPVGLKVGPTLSTDDLLKLIDKLNPENEKGRLTPDDIATMIQKAEECELNDKKIKDIHSARSSLENYLSNSQRIIDSQNFTQKVDENIKKEISNLINDIYEWLDENTDISDPDIDLTPNDFNDQYKMLEDLLLPILEKLSNPDKD